MKAMILVDNRAERDWAGEWGLAVYLEHRGHKLLLDTGSSGLFAENAGKMGVDLGAVEFGVLSHAHFDHSDGLDTFFEKNATAKFYLRAGTGENCFSKKVPGLEYIGIKRGSLRKYADRIEYASGDVEVIPGVWLIPHKTPGLEEIGRRANMFVERDGAMIVDDFAHEQSLVLETEQGLVILNSCCHGGAGNIIREVAETFPGRQICALIGGLHLFQTDEDGVRALAGDIRSTGITQVITGHCTGEEAFAILKEELGDRVQQMYTGMEIEIG